MNPSKLYIPNPQKWVGFFDKVAKVKQSGGGRVQKILPIDKYIAIESKVGNIPVKSVTPAEQTVQQAVSELKRENIKPESVMDLSQKSNTRRHKRTSVTKKSKQLKPGNKSKKLKSVTKRKKSTKGKNSKKRKLAKKGKIVKISRKQQTGGKRVKAKPNQKKKETFVRKDIFSF